MASHSSDSSLEVNPEELPKLLSRAANRKRKAEEAKRKAEEDASKSIPAADSPKPKRRLYKMRDLVEAQKRKIKKFKEEKDDQSRSAQKEVRVDALKRTRAAKSIADDLSLGKIAKKSRAKTVKGVVVTENPSDIKVKDDRYQKECENLWK